MLLALIKLFYQMPTDNLVPTISVISPQLAETQSQTVCQLLFISVHMKHVSTLFLLHPVCNQICFYDHTAANSLPAFLCQYISANVLQLPSHAIFVNIFIGFFPLLYIILFYHIYSQEDLLDAYIPKTGSSVRTLFQANGASHLSMIFLWTHERLYFPFFTAHEKFPQRLCNLPCASIVFLMFLVSLYKLCNVLKRA